MTPSTVAVAFNDRINARDLDGLASLMAPDHAFIDKAGVRIAGKPACLEAWRKFFEAFPDYRNEVYSAIAATNCVILIGRSTCSDRRLAGPALWTAKVAGALVTEWRVRDDAPAERRAIGLGADR